MAARQRAGPEAEMNIAEVWHSQFHRLLRESEQQPLIRSIGSTARKGKERKAMEAEEKKWDKPRHGTETVAMARMSRMWRNQS